MAGRRLARAAADGQPARPRHADARTVNRQHAMRGPYSTAQSERARFDVTRAHFLSAITALAKVSPAAADALLREQTGHLHQAAAAAGRMATRRAGA